jgi:hypothetical protein
MSDLTIPIGPIDIDDPDAVASDFEAARAILDYEPEDDVKGDVVGHGFHGNRYTGGIGGSHGPDPRAIATAEDFEKLYRDAPVEHMVVIAMNGEVLSDTAGTATTAEETVSLKALNGVITHNHPVASGGVKGEFVIPTLSDADIRAGVAAGVAAIRVISQETGKTYEMQFLDNPTQREQMLFQGVANDYLNHNTEIANQEFIGAGGIDNPKAVEEVAKSVQQIWSDTWKRAAAESPRAYSYREISA